LEERVLNKAQIGDLLVIEGAGAYCSAMSVKNYNSFPEAGELLISKSGKIIEIRKRQKLQQMRQNEI
jgi:diaminopimelate decarboxylase